MTLKCKANKTQWPAMMKILILISVLVMPFYLAGNASAASDSREKREIGYSRHINIDTGQTKWRVAATEIKRSALSKQRVLEVLAKENIKRIEEYAEWLVKNVAYRRDKKSDTWSLPEETLARRYGDCEDLAFLNREVLGALGYQPQVVAFRKKNWEKWHAICVFEKEGRYLYFDNRRLKDTPAASMEQFAKEIGAEGNIVAFGSFGITEVLQKTINLKDIARGTKFEKKDGSVYIVAGRY
ncbi:MAG: transglutaminase-like cysteine peptidase [Candidatus Omnitrophica bacterium]|nr:transglutaminase-like cysteine peptidase [Candidatus Omnitrophota bacterium]